MAKTKLPIEVSVKGTAAFSWLYKKDDKFAKKGEDGKYKLSLVIDKDELPKLTARLDGGATPIGGTEWVEHILKMHEDADGDNSNAPIKDGDKPVDKKGKPKEVREEFVNTYMVNFKSGYQPQLVDTKKNDLPADVKIMSGDTVKVAFRPNIFDGGCNLYMNAVMLVEKNATGGGAGAFGDDEEGYVVDASAADAFGGGAASDGDY